MYMNNLHYVYNKYNAYNTYLPSCLQPRCPHTAPHLDISVFLVHAFLLGETDQSMLLQLIQTHDTRDLQSLHWQRHLHSSHHHPIATCHDLRQLHVQKGSNATTLTCTCIPKKMYVCTCTYMYT